MELTVSCARYPACIRLATHVLDKLCSTILLFFSYLQIYDILEILFEQLAQGGTAVGTGLNTKKGYVRPQGRKV
jgi:hypothetical protein